MTPNQAWVGVLETDADLMDRHAQVCERTAAALGVPITQIVVEEIPAANGTLLVGHYLPALEGS